jgi:hypothetical protein
VSRRSALIDFQHQTSGSCWKSWEKTLRDTWPEVTIHSLAGFRRYERTRYSRRARRAHFADPWHWCKVRFRKMQPNPLGRTLNIAESGTRFLTGPETFYMSFYGIVALNETNFGPLNTQPAVERV